jgi:hypothetical protein
MSVYQHILSFNDNIVSFGGSKHNNTDLNLLVRCKNIISYVSKVLVNSKQSAN